MKLLHFGRFAGALYKIDVLRAVKFGLNFSII